MKKICISMIAAIGKNRELGKDNKLLWHIPDDLKRFRKLTQGHAVIMGRKTYESIGKPLPNRTNIIITRDNNVKIKDCIIVHSLEEALHTIEFKDEVFIIGGGQIFTQALPFADKLYLTIVNKAYDADTFFPEYSRFNKIIYKETKEYEGLHYTFLDLEKEQTH